MRSRYRTEVQFEGSCDAKNREANALTSMLFVRMADESHTVHCRTVGLDVHANWANFVIGQKQRLSFFHHFGFAGVGNFANLALVLLR